MVRQWPGFAGTDTVPTGRFRWYCWNRARERSPLFDEGPRGPSGSLTSHLSWEGG